MADGGWRRGRSWRRLAAPALLAALFACWEPRAGLAADRDTLWDIVNGRCVPDYQRAGLPGPCALVDTAGGAGRGYAVLKDRNGVAQFLLIPASRVAGIQDPAVLSPDAANFFDAAWDARTFVEGALGRSLPRDAISLVANAVPALSQDQLHIHVDCLKPAVRDALRAQAAAIGPDWAVLPVPLAGRRYSAMRVSGARLGRNDPFKLLADGLPGARAEMGQHTLIVVGTTVDGQPGFIILERRAAPDAGDNGHGTELQDRGCAVASLLPP